MSNKVSIVMPTYNRAHFLKEALENRLSQTYANLEVIVVVDGCTDETSELLAGYSDPRIKVVINETNLGFTRALNVGFSHATGEYMTWTGDDDLYTADAITAMVNVLDTEPDIHFVYADYWIVDYDTGRKLSLERVADPDTLCDSNGVGLCFLYRRQVYETLGGCDPAAHLAEDYEYWLRIHQQFRMHPIHLALFYYRDHPGTLTNQKGTIHKRWRLISKVKRERFGWSWRRYTAEMAHIDIDEAFNCYQDREYARVPGLVLRGVARNPAWLRNLGVSSIALRSLLRLGLPDDSAH